MKIFVANKETFDQMRGHDFRPHDGEGVVAIKLVALKPKTIKDEDPERAVSDAQTVLVCGRLIDIKQQFNTWLDALIEEYKNGN